MTERPLTGKSRSSPARRAAAGAASRSRSAKPAPRSTRPAAAPAGRRSEVDRPETIEETAELVTAAGGEGIALEVDHLEPEQVAALVARIDADHGRLDVLVNDIWGAEHLFEWNTPLWEHDLDNGLRMLRLALDTHLITSHHALPLLIRSPAGWSSRSPTAPPPTTPSASASRCSTTSPRRP